MSEWGERRDKEEEEKHNKLVKSSVYKNEICFREHQDEKKRRRERQMIRGRVKLKLSFIVPAAMAWW